MSQTPTTSPKLPWSQREGRAQVFAGLLIILTAICGVVFLVKLAWPKHRRASPVPQVSSVGGHRAKAPRTGLAAYDFTPDEYLGRLNAMWSRSGADGAFSLVADDVVQAGDDKGGRIKRACASEISCVMIEANQAGKVTDIVVAAQNDTSDEQVLNTMRAHILAVKAVEPSAPELGEVIKRQFARLKSRAEAKPEVVGASCMTTFAMPGAGIWTTLSTAPCSRQ